jgi:hypothetical protein
MSVAATVIPIRDNRRSGKLERVRTPRAQFAPFSFVSPLVGAQETG